MEARQPKQSFEESLDQAQQMNRDFRGTSSVPTDLVGRITAFLVSPEASFIGVRNEPLIISDFFRSYLAPLAGVSALAGMLGQLIFGGPLGIKVSFGSALQGAIISFALALLMVFIMSHVLGLIASQFFGETQPHETWLKLVGYAWTASFIGSIAAIVPYLGFLFALGFTVYSLYTFYLGLGVLTSIERRGLFIAATIVAGFVLGAVVSLLAGGLLIAR
ncbi:MAG: YIP1 family protein [Bdellovibrionales bacterium]|nr:YIP1 family protein [Bdellovibrionales bacterium]